MRKPSHGGDLAMATPGEYLEAHPIQQKAMPAASSWGRNGYSEHWVNPRTEWMWRPLHEAAVRMRQTVQSHPSLAHGCLEDRTLRHAGPELVLAQASDRPF